MNKEQVKYEPGAVWLATGWSRTAHSLDGPLGRERWSTRCGYIIRDYHDAGTVDNGVVIVWKILDHSRVSLCRRCFR